MVDVGKPAVHHDEDKPARPRARGPAPIEAPGSETDPVSHRLFELLPDAVMMLDGDGIVRYVNPAGVRLVGATAAGEVLGRSVWIFVHPDDERQARVREEQLRRGAGFGFFEQHLVRLDGRVTPIETASVPILDEEGRPGVLLTTRDLSGRKTMERALNESRDLFEKAFRLGPAASTISRLDDGVFIDVNGQFAELTGYTRDELLGRASLDLGIWVDPAQRRRMVAEIRATGSALNQELTLRRKDGTLRQVICSMQRIDVRGDDCLMGISIDVTERHRAAQAEEETRSLFYKIFYASPTGIAITRVSDDRIIEVNDAWCTLTGYARDDAIGKAAHDLALWTDADLRAAFVERFNERSALQDFEIEVHRHSGEVRTALVSLQEMRIEGERCLLSVLVDITDRKLTENKLREAKDHAEAMARLKSTFLTNLTHEIRTPLTVILGFTSILRQGVRKEYARFVQLIERSGRRLLLMLDSMLDLAQLEAGTLRMEQRPYNLGDVVQSVLQVLRPLAADKGLDLTFVPPTERTYARLDHAVLTRVLNNVLDNAVKFTEAGEIAVRLDAEGAWAYVRISDTGIGIDEKFLPLVFEAFSQESTGLERTHQGSGLGLAVSRRLIELMGGHIEVESKKGEGSIFTIILPREQ